MSVTLDLKEDDKTASFNQVEKITQEVKLKLISNLLEDKTSFYFDNWPLLFIECIRLYLMHPNVASNKYFLEEKQTVAMCLNILGLSIQFIQFQDESLREYLYTVLKSSAEILIRIFYSQIELTQSQFKFKSKSNQDSPNNNNNNNNNDNKTEKTENKYSDQLTLSTLDLNNFQYKDSISPIFLQYIKQSRSILTNLQINEHSWPTLVAEGSQFLKNYEPIILVNRQKLILIETLSFVMVRAKIFENIEDAKLKISGLINTLYVCDQITGQNQISGGFKCCQGNSNHNNCCVIM